ncbi:zinc finger CCHC domain-containing protein 10 [Toxorhynchites rutilus septentrionalis]|uniref:zinc finger CCHC domain-containing protein 10 n=1 Tax=Toxorhynchites rutilus septentrionalis TaxID=329112 RepID=UPI00247A2B6E|nr:zinc finger CCHC domain-containing protein 10 [Toxorhynchites rutilus septentrionalis]
MHLGALKLAKKQKEAKLAAAFPKGIRCQKCLEFGHWSYECKGKRKYVHRSSRTQVLKKNLNKLESKEVMRSDAPKAKKDKYENNHETANSSSSDDSSSSSDSSSDSSSSDSDSSSSSSSESDFSSSSSSNSSDSESDSSSSSSDSDENTTKKKSKTKRKK